MKAIPNRTCDIINKIDSTTLVDVIQVQETKMQSLMTQFVLIQSNILFNEQTKYPIFTQLA